MFAAISGSDAAGAAAVGRMTIDRLVESGYPRPYACALVAAGACTGILIPPSIAYIIIGLVLGISASTLFLAALIPGLAILLSILDHQHRREPHLRLRRRRQHDAWRNGAANLGRALKSGWYAFIVPGIIFYGIFSGRLTPTEAGATAVVVTIIMGFILRHAEALRLPGDAGQFGQGERRHPADHRLLAAAGRRRWPSWACRRVSSRRRRRSDRRALGPDPADDRHPDRRGLRDGNDAQHRDPCADPEAAGRQYRHERDPVLHHDDHGAGRGLHHAAAWASTSLWCRASPANRSSRSPRAPCPSCSSCWS